MECASLLALLLGRRANAARRGLSSRRTAGTRRRTPNAVAPAKRPLRSWTCDLLDLERPRPFTLRGGLRVRLAYGMRQLAGAFAREAGECSATGLELATDSGDKSPHSKRCCACEAAASIVDV